MYDNEPAKFIRKNCTLIEEGSIPGMLFDLGTYPGAVFDPSSSSLVFGEVYRIDQNEEDLVRFLDEFERVGTQFKQPNEYIRKMVPVTTNNGIIEASSYLYNWNLDGLKLIESGRYENQKGNRG